MNILVSLVFWCATGLYLVCAYPIAPPELVSGMSSSLIANVLFLIATIILIFATFSRGKSKRGTDKRERLYRRVAYGWLCVVILFVFLAVNHLVRRGTNYMTVPMLLGYALGLVMLAGVFFILLRLCGGEKNAVPKVD